MSTTTLTTTTCEYCLHKAPGVPIGWYSLSFQPSPAHNRITLTYDKLECLLYDFFRRYPRFLREAYLVIPELAREHNMGLASDEPGYVFLTE
jgi:hypothetical protein